MSKNTKVKNLNGQNVIEEMRRVGRGIESRLGKKILHLGVKIESVEHNVALVAENQVGMKEKLDATFEMVGKLSEDITVVKDNVEFVKNSLKKKVDASEFAILERKVKTANR